MMIIDTVKQPGFTQWIESFVADVMKDANIIATQVVITELYNKRIYLLADEQEFMIRMYNCIATERDKCGITCAEIAEYMLYIGHEHCEEEDEPISLKVVASGNKNIRWSNDPKIYQDEVNQYIKLHGMPEEKDLPQDGEFIPVNVKVLCGGEWELHMDVRSLSSAEVLAVVNYFATGEMDEAFQTPELLRYINDIDEICVRELINVCFENGQFASEYTCKAIATCVAYKLCSAECAADAWIAVDHLYQQYCAGNANAIHMIKAVLMDFFMETQPYVISIP